MSLPAVVVEFHLLMTTFGPFPLPHISGDRPPLAVLPREAAQVAEVILGRGSRLILLIRCKGKEKEIRTRNHVFQGRSSPCTRAFRCFNLFVTKIIPPVFDECFSRIGKKYNREKNCETECSTLFPVNYCSIYQTNIHVAVGESLSMSSFTSCGYQKAYVFVATVECTSLQSNTSFGGGETRKSFKNGRQ